MTTENKPTESKPTGNQSTPAPRLALRQVQPDMYLFDTLLGETMDTADRDFHALLAPMRLHNFAQADDLAGAHNAAMTTIAEAAFLAGVQMGRNPWSMFIETRPGGGESGQPSYLGEV